MASAAAVAADEARSPLGNDLGEDEGRPGEITSGIYSHEEEIPGVNGDNEDEDEDDDLPSNLMRRGERSSRRVQDEQQAEDDDLFGEDDDAAGDEKAEDPPQRFLDDEELDSGDDLDRADRQADDAAPEYEEQVKAVMDMEIARQPVPEPSDGELYLLKIPNFMSIEPHAWDHTTFQPPTTDHHSTTAPSATFSAYNTALTTVRWRHSPSDPKQLQSNARINRWSDGSLTLQLASDPTTQYEIDGNALAPPQRNPIKPTPTSIEAASQKGGRAGNALDGKYDQRKDAFTYLMRPHEASSSLIVTHKVTAGLSVKQSASVEDDAIERLQASLAAASNASKVNGTTGLTLVHISEDPEAAKARALEAVRQKEKADKRHQAAIDREAARSNRALGRVGLSSNRYSGLNVGMLEDDDGDGGGGRTYSSPNKTRNPRRRRNSEYSEDEDLGRRRFTKEDEYDEEDDFVARSDEEEEIVDDEDDPDDGIVDDRRGSSPKRGRGSPQDDEEADAPGEEDDEEEVQQSRSKRRRIIDEDDDDEE